MVGAWRDRLLVAAPLLALLGLGVIDPDGDGPTICLFANATGMACPGCGMTRAAGYLVRGDLGAAITLHPLVALIVIQSVAGWAWLMWRREDRVGPLPQRLTSAILIGTGVSLLAVWLLRMWTGSLPPV